MEFIIKEQTEKFKKKIKDDTEQDLLIEKFQEFLLQSINSIRKSDSKFVKSDDESIKRIIMSEVDIFLQMDNIQIKKRLLIDEKFIEIHDFSYHLYDMAVAKIKGENVEECYEIPEVIKKFKRLLTEVKEYNQEEAKELVSEALLDLFFIKQENPKMYSLRLYHFKKSKNKEEQ